MAIAVAVAVLTGVLLTWIPPLLLLLLPLDFVSMNFLLNLLPLVISVLFLAIIIAPAAIVADDVVVAVVGGLLPVPNFLNFSTETSWNEREKDKNERN